MHKFIIVSALLCLVLTCRANDKEVKIENSKAGITLSGTLAQPDSGVPRALLFLASGSGAQNRDEEVMGKKPFKVLSDSLVAAGYGVLRVDDRGVGESTGEFENATVNDFTDDAIACVEFLRTEFPNVKVGILGHSQGGQIAVKAASQGKTDFIVTLAGPAWKGDSLIMSQCRALAVATTGSWPGEGLERRLLDIAMSDISPVVGKALAYNEFANVLGDAASVPQVQQQVLAQLAPLFSPMYRDLLRYDPAEDIRNVKVPWLALNGDKDLQVLSENLKTFEDLNPNVVTVVLPGHNHLFQHAVTGLPDEYPLAGQSPSDETLNKIRDFLNALFPED